MNAMKEKRSKRILCINCKESISRSHYFAAGHKNGLCLKQKLKQKIMSDDNSLKGNTHYYIYY